MQTIEITWLREVNWSLLRAGFPFLHEVKIRLSDSLWDYVEIDATVEYRSFVLGRCIHRAESRGVEEVLFCDPQVEWQFEHSLLFVDDAEPVPAELKLIVRTGRQEQPTVYELAALPLHVLAPKQWDCGVQTDEKGQFEFIGSYPYYHCIAPLGERGAIAVPESRQESLTAPQQHLILSSIAALCLPNHEAIEQLCRDTEAAIRAVHKGAKGDPITLRQSTEGRLLLFEALYSQLWKHQFAYTIEDVSFAHDHSRWTQRVRLPDELEKDPIGNLTCIDWALIAAAACERWEIDPLILLVRQGDGLHAMTAIRSVDPYGGNKKAPAVFRLSSGTAGSILAADFTVDSDFDQAAKAAQHFLATSEFCVAIDILAARKAGCIPLPLHLKSRIVDVSFHTRYSALAPDTLRRYKTLEGQAGPEEIFVPLRCSVMERPELDSLDALEYLLQETDSTPTKIAILANSGAGKSYLLAKLFLEKLKAYGARPAFTKIPVFFPLQKFVASAPIEVQLQEHLCALGYPATSEAEFHQTLEEGRFTVYLDALDEVPLRGGAEVEQLLERIAPLFRLPNLELVLTARLGLFGARTLSLLSSFQVLLLREWDEGNWGDFVDRYTAEDYINQAEADALKNLQGPVRSLITKPLYCQMIVEEREYVLQFGVKNEVELFRRYIDRFWERREVAHEFLKPEEKNTCMQYIAYRMEYLNRHIWTITQLATEINKKYAHLGNFDEWKKYLMDIRVYSFLDTSVSVAKEEEFSFSHEAFREFFLAELLVERLNAGDLQAISDRKISLEVARMMGGLLALDPHYEPTKLVSVMNRPGVRGTHRSRNLALVQIAMQGGCPEWKLDGADFSGLSLRGTDFTGCWLNAAEFLNCDLQDCCFDGAHLNKAKFDYSNVLGASFRSTSGKPSFVSCIGQDLADERTGPGMSPVRRWFSQWFWRRQV